MRFATIALVFGGLLAAGCGGPAPPSLAPVQGKVYFRGRPLPAGTIVFAADPDRGTNGPLARGEIQSDGSYTLRTGDLPGAVVGWHRVTVVAVEMTATTPRLLVPARYGDPLLSGLACEVQAGKDNGINFNLE